jgi:hypothetical protein
MYLPEQWYSKNNFQKEMYVFLKYIVKNENLDIFNGENGVIADWWLMVLGPLLNFLEDFENVFFGLCINYYIHITIFQIYSVKVHAVSILQIKNLEVAISSEQTNWN